MKIKQFVLSLLVTVSAAPLLCSGDVVDPGRLKIGLGHTLSGSQATIAGGKTNSASGALGVVSGGEKNINNAEWATISGGFLNFITTNGELSAIGGGLSNLVDSEYAFIGGGSSNVLRDDYGVIAGGWGNSDLGHFSVIAGGAYNIIDASGGFGSGDFIGGGSYNTNYGGWAFIGGGAYNMNHGYFGTIGGGTWNQILAGNDGVTIAGGSYNAVDFAEGYYNAIGGGWGNKASYDYSTIAGGRSNTVSATYSMVPGGFRNTAAGSSSFAAGLRAKANHNGAFVWGDSNDSDVSSSAANQFIARASGGVTFYSNSGQSSGVTMASGGGSWSSVSDKNVKENFQPVNAREILARVAELPITTWNYKSQAADVRHIGPVAQDFAAAFKVGEDDKRITTVDESGVALAAIQGLHQLLCDRDSEIKSLKSALAEIKKRLDSIPTAE